MTSPFSWFASIVGMGANISMCAEGKAEKNSLARKFRLTNTTKQKLAGVLQFKTSQFFEQSRVDFELEGGATKVVLLPHNIRSGCELEDEEVVHYVVTLNRKEDCTISTTVRLRDHSLFSIESEQGAPVDFTKAFTRQFTIRNSSSITLPASATLMIAGTACFQPAFVIVGEMLSGATKTVTLEHRPEDEKKINLETIEECTSYALKYNGIILKEFTRRARMYEYSGYLARYQPSNGAFIRILVCGVFGSGKSSVICSICTALSPDDLVLTNVAPISPFGGHGTTTFGTFPCGPALPFVLLVDTWGKTEINYAQQELLAMLDGIMKEGASMDNPEMEDDAEGKRNKIHSVLMLVPAANLNLDCERAMLKQALTKKYNATVLMSKCDMQLDEAKGETAEFRANPNTPLAVLEAKKATIGAAVGTSAVLRVAPYLLSETTKIFERDRLTLRILELALNAGKGFQTYNA